MPSPEQRKSLEERVNQYHQNLLTGDGGAAQARRYWADRGLTKAAAERFKIGYTGDTGTATANRLAIPYETPAGPWQVKYRRVGDGDSPKYIYDDGAEQHLYNTQTLLTADRVVIVEGELDAIAVETIAGLPAVAYPGAETWRGNKHWVWCLDSCQEIAVIADGDDAGRKAARVVAESLRRALPDINTTVVDLGDGEDSNSFLAAHGAVDFIERLGWL